MLIRDNRTVSFLYERKSFLNVLLVNVAVANDTVDGRSSDPYLIIKLDFKDHTFVRECPYIIQTRLENIKP